MKTIFLIALVMSAILAITQALSCPKCDAGVIKCPEIHKLKCKGRLVTDVCGCCAVCAKVKGENCGGPFNITGKCDCGLKCLKSPKDIATMGEFNAKGTCVPR